MRLGLYPKKSYKGHPPRKRKEQALETLKASKVEQAMARSDKNRLRKLTCEMAAAVARNNEVTEWKGSGRSEGRCDKLAKKAEEKAKTAKAKADEVRAATATRVWNARKKAGTVVDKAVGKVEKSAGKRATAWYRRWRARWGKPYLTPAGLADLRGAADAAGAVGAEEGGDLRAAFDAQASTLLSVAAAEAKVRELQDVADELAAEASVQRQEQKYYAKLRASADNYKAFKLPVVFDNGLVDQRAPGAEPRGFEFGPMPYTDWNARYLWICTELEEALGRPVPADYRGMEPPIASHDPAAAMAPMLRNFATPPDVPPAPAPGFGGAPPPVTMTMSPVAGGGKLGGTAIGVPYGFAPLAGAGAYAIAAPGYFKPPAQGIGGAKPRGIPTSPGVSFLSSDRYRQHNDTRYRYRRHLLWSSPAYYGHHHHHHRHHHQYHHHHHDGAAYNEGDHHYLDDEDDFGEPPEGMEALEEGTLEEVVEADAVDMYGGAGPRDLDDGGARGGGAGPGALRASDASDLLRRREDPALKWTGAAAVAAAAVAAVVERRWGEVCADAEEDILGPVPRPVPLLLSRLADATSVAAEPPATAATMTATTTTEEEEEEEEDVTLVTQLSADRLPKLEAQIAAWSGPVSAAVYVSGGHNGGMNGDDAAASAAEAELAAMARRAHDAGRLWRVSVVLVRPDRAATAAAAAAAKDVAAEGVAYPEEKGVAATYDAEYPVNALRNVALDAAKTDLVFLLDVDFVPSSGAREAVLAAGASTACARGDALVVPAFELADGAAVGGAADVAAAGTAGFRAATRERVVEPFHVGHYPAGHRATDSARWVDAATPYEVSYGKDTNLTSWRASLGCLEPTSVSADTE